MTDKTLGEILTGDTRREDLHRALDEILDAQVEDGGALDAPAFWTFVASLADGSGIPAEIEEGAALLLAEHRVPDTPEDLWQAWQWAVLVKLLQRLEAPAKVGLEGSILPESFMPAALKAIAINRIQNGGEGADIDLLAMNTSWRGTEQAMIRTARGLLTRHVLEQAILNNRSEDETRRRIFPGDLPNRTWTGWKRETAEQKGFDEIEPYRASLRAALEAGEEALSLPAEQVAEIWRLAYRPNPIRRD
ncbi:MULTISPECIES: hypothetical protein [unclassified Roseovarius]|uniref:hypothetical protein n=1 Tax=unclassified Roseovarius TaxID=2614913 RepID=UPI00273D32A5|nr:hypothetical protein [Roseovarius sp. MMSF_3350]